MRLIRFQPLWALIFVLLLTGTVSAREILQGEICTVPAETTIQGSLFVVCETLDIAGTVEGDVFGVALRARIGGTVQGSIYLAAAQLDVAGAVQRDVHFVGPVLRLLPRLPDAAADVPATAALQGNVIAAALSTQVSRGVRVPGQITSFGYQLLVEGRVENEINFWGSALLIDGTARSDVYASVGDPANDSSQIETLLLPFNLDIDLRDPGMTVTERGLITGMLSYTGPVEGRFEGRLLQEPIFNPVLPVLLPTLEEPATFSVYLQMLLREITMLLAVGAVCLIFAPRWVRAPLVELRFRPVSSLTLGMLSFLLSFPVVLILVVLAIIVLIVLNLLGLNGVALIAAIVFSLLNLGGATIFYMVAIFVSRVVVALALGRFVLRLFPRTRHLHSDTRYALVAGVLLLTLVASVPYVGWVINAIALFIGLGGILVITLERFRTLREGSLNPAGHTYPLSTAVARPRAPLAGLPRMPTPLAPPPPPSLPTRPGMDNLPEGFSFDFFQDN